MQNPIKNVKRYKMKDYGIHWFRRDLRIAGNPGLQYQFSKFTGRTLGIFTFDKKFLGRDDFSYNRFQFFLNRLKELKKELQASGGDLLVLDIGPEDAFKKLFTKLNHKPKTITFCRDYEPFAVKRDDTMTSFFENSGIDVQSFRDHLLIEPHELEKESGKGEGYKVYSPFARKWIEIFEHDEVQVRIESQKNGLSYMKNLASGNNINELFSLKWKDLFNDSPLDDHLDHYIDENKKSVDIEIPPCDTKTIYSALKNFEKKLDEYGEKRDFPYEPNTSRFSIYLKHGSLTISQIIAFYDLKGYKKKKSGRDTFLSELIWREFYYHILNRWPKVEESAFLEQYNNLNWSLSKKNFQAWKEGQTGFPIVDAGMRELNTTGWMHNRVRMIVASFLTKDLLIHWKWGEKYFMEKLLDGDLAPNNGGWQWAASTGCDPQPYFRIFNPWLQSKKFDPDGTYIKTYLPELKNIDPKKLHAPIEGHDSYPEPIVDHKEQRELALSMYKEAKDS